MPASTSDQGWALITGGSRGIGYAAAEALAARGLAIHMLSADAARITAAAERLRASGARVTSAQCDVANAEGVEAAAHEALALAGTPPRVVVANAGVVARAPVHEMSVAAFDHVIGVNLRGVFLIARAFLGPMRRAGTGRFIATASISATLGTANASAYNASKWAVVGFIKSLAEELRGTGLQAFALNPGAVDTDMLRGSPYAAQMSAADVARVITFAALDAPDAMNGAAIDIFGP